MIPAKKINGVAVSSAGKQLCLSCHDSSSDWFGPNYPSTSNPTRDATGYPVAGTWPGSTTYESDTNPHRLIPETTVTVGQSEPVRREQGDCLYCHAAHGSSNAYDGLVANFTVPATSTLAADKSDGSYAALCFKCHGGAKPSGFTDTPIDIKQFATASSTTSQSAGGHSIVTSGGTLPVGSPLPCFECHNPHGSKRGNGALISDERGASLGTKSPADVRAFCFTCHTTSDTTLGWDSTTSTFTPVTSADKVVGIGRDGGVLHLPANDGHAQGDLQSCYECHGDSYDTGGRNVHDPASGAIEAPVIVPAIISLVESSTVMTSSIDASASADASASLNASGSIDASGTASNVPTGSVDTSLSALGGATGTDTVPPLTISDAQTSYVGSATITLTAVDDTGGVGVAETYWTLDGGDISTGTVVSTSTPGAHTLTFWSVDAAGNVESATTVDFTITSDQAMAVMPILAVRRGQVIASAGT